MSEKRLWRESEKRRGICQIREERVEGYTSNVKTTRIPQK